MPKEQEKEATSAEPESRLGSPRQSELEIEVWLEPDVLNLLGINAGRLSVLRNEYNFPCIQIGRRRIYLEKSVLAWLKRFEGKFIK